MTEAESGRLDLRTGLPAFARAVTDLKAACARVDAAWVVLQPALASLKKSLEAFIAAAKTINLSDFNG